MVNIDYIGIKKNNKTPLVFTKRNVETKKKKKGMLKKIHLL